ncbi:ribosomal protein L20-like protein [Leptospira interrogans serovar Icterohaemorrhagiae str. Verdun HP]|uniref:Large ribosomal subunit protein bL20 n=2 Tax=Leptospira interrogans TaxID=173 RepID=M6RQG8_LEPIR|nr:ribosomal protein L20-like protein [Leptospira interrogans serovar Pyrogenes str. L0374]EMO03133.1 ribosomal protein L20-like protein [Leptospira interrogans serovar Icterohaemorrhagiae str. Verdun HP]EMO25877.1 ribosomal protein L20-like protein [Leptospira interrogans serovar Bataviae str. HAI135]EMO76857.1 ribosomal protein L20-like protein [Leptospira kirschneri str. 200801925]
MSYSVFMNSLKKLGIHMDRKSLAELAFNDREVFNSLVEKIKVAG